MKRRLKLLACIGIFSLLIACHGKHKNKPVSAEADSSNQKVVEDIEGFTYVVYNPEKSTRENVLYSPTGDSTQIPFVLALKDSSSFFVYYPFTKFIDSAQLLVVSKSNLNEIAWDTSFNNVVYPGQTIRISHKLKFYRTILSGKTNNKQSEVFERASF